MTLVVRGCAPRRGALSVLCLAAGLLLALLAPARAQDAQADLPPVDVVEIDGRIDGVVAGHLLDALAAAGRDGTPFALQLHSPGVVGADVGELVDAILASPVPVIVWVGPSGSQATGGAFLLAQAAHLLGMAPATSMGAALPVDLGGDGGLTGAADTEALAVELARLRGRDTELAAAAVTDQRAVVATTGVDLAPAALLPRELTRAALVDLGPQEIVDAGIVDFTASTLPDALGAVAGRDVALADGSTVTLGDFGERVDARIHNLGLLEGLLHTVAHPAAAYLLLLVGLAAIAFEVFQPGFGVAGISGVVLTGLGAYGLTVLPTSWLAAGVLVLGVVLLAVDLALAGLGPLTFAGTVAVAGGSWWLFDGPAVLRLPLWLVLLGVLAVVGFFVIVMTMVLRAQGHQALADTDGLVGQTGVVRSMLNPEGHIFVGGALWRGRAPAAAGKVKTGTHVRVVGLNDRLTLDVEIVEAESTKV